MGDVVTMLALEHILGRATRERDMPMLAIACEAWERAGYCSVFTFDAARSGTWVGWGHGEDDYSLPCETVRTMVDQCRYRKNKAKLRHQADALLAAIPHLPLDEREWSLAKHDRSHRRKEVA